MPNYQFAVHTQQQFTALQVTVMNGVIVTSYIFRQFNSW